MFLKRYGGNGWHQLARALPCRLSRIPAGELPEAARETLVANGMPEDIVQGERLRDASDTNTADVIFAVALSLAFAITFFVGLYHVIRMLASWIARLLGVSIT